MAQLPDLSAAIPVLETPRLRMRGHRLDDLESSAAMWGDPIVTRHIGGRPFTREECWSRLLRYVGHWSLMGFGYWVVEEKASGRFVGEVGLSDFQREIEPPLTDLHEIGWVLAPWAFGRGYATEAVQAALDWAHEHLGPNGSACMIDPENAASIRVAEKCGFELWVETRYKDEPVVVLRR